MSWGDYTVWEPSTRRVRRSDGVEYDSIDDAAEDNKARGLGIWKVCNGLRERAAGYGWVYIDEQGGLNETFHLWG